MRTLAVCIAVCQLTGFSQGVLEFRAYPTGASALPPNQRNGWSLSWFTVFPDNRVSGNVVLEWTYPVASVDIFRSSSANELGSKLYTMHKTYFNPPVLGTGGDYTYVLDTTLTQAEVNDLVGGLWWVNVSTTEAFPDWQMRGQITQVPEPTTVAFTIFGIALLITFRLTKNRSGCQKRLGVTKQL